MRLRLSDPALLDEFVAFLAGAGFSVAVEDRDTIRVALPLEPGPNGSEAELGVVLAVWLEIGLRIWRDLWPDGDAIVLAAREPARRTASG